ncbi:MAG: lysyl-tRNA synthetase, lysyl-tRNA synthetase, class [Candidatus Saccharibacteria bacterium]|nr:lysyl-tRNA synthetase, lysyl-tRNA synthetase, class [Candidatus Saccharibacteria bacterium]
MYKGDAIEFALVNKQSLKIANTIKAKKGELIAALTKYETYKTAEDEIERTLDLLTSLGENKLYFKEIVGPVAVFMPSNQPLYSLACFAIVPAFMSKKVSVKPPEIMNGFYEEMLAILDIKNTVPNIEYMKLSRKECLSIFTATKLDKHTNRRHPLYEAVIFTGTTQNADKLRKKFHSSTLFITNGSGHNPIVVTESADTDKAVAGIMSVRTYNQGQDCAAPNSVLVHASVYDTVLEQLRKAIAALKVGEYSSPETDIGPISRPETLSAVKDFLLRNSVYIDETTDGIIRARTLIIEPTIVTKPLKDGANFEELFAPVFVIQKYEDDTDLNNYFEDKQYADNEMYTTVYGASTYVTNFVTRKEMIIHDTDLHAPGIERGVKPYGGYGRGASCISKDGSIVSCPTLPQRDLFEYLVLKKKIDPGEKRSEKKPDFQKSNRSILKKNMHWSERLADRVIKQFPDQAVYTCAAGISPSGVVHFGNFRDLFTSHVVSESLIKKGKKTRLVLYWDDFDSFREVPADIDPTFEKYIGMPYSQIPSPDGTYASYAEKFEKEFEASIKDMGIETEYVYQTVEYKSGTYDDLIIHSLKNRKAIADILLSFMSEQAKIEKSIDDATYREDYYPIVLYSRFTGKDNTRILGYDGTSIITYKCFDTGKTESVDITKDHIVKLSWKIDWAMRWSKDRIAFEPAGSDHASPGGSFDTSSTIATKIFSSIPPVLEEYKFVGIQGVGGKMSSVKGGVVSLNNLLDIYTPEMLKWLYADKPPAHSFELSFGKDIFRQYDEFDKATAGLNSGTIDNALITALDLSGVAASSTHAPISFRQLLGLGQIVQWDKKKLKTILDNQELVFDSKLIDTRLARTRAWLERYNEDEAITIQSDFNHDYVSCMTVEQIALVNHLYEYLADNKTTSIDEINVAIYDIPKVEGIGMNELKTRQKAFFKDIYNLLINDTTGPRLSTFLWAANRKKVLQLLDIKEYSS